MLRKKAFHIITLLTATFALAEFGLAMANPDVVLTGDVTRADYQKYKPLSFNVPAGIKRITVNFAYDTREVKTTIDSGPLDTRGVCGWSVGDTSSCDRTRQDLMSDDLPGAVDAG